MSLLVIILRGALGPPGGDGSIGKMRTAQRWATNGSVSVCVDSQPVATRELELIGVQPGLWRVSAGELVASAFKADPPDRSVCFQLSLANLEDGLLNTGVPPPTPDEERELRERLERLETRSLFPRWGQGLVHLLVWPGGSLDLGTTEPTNGLVYAESLPQGEGDTKLRAFIDDSVNLLMDCEANRRRIDEGKPALNLLWPWGQGLLNRYPDLCLQRGSACKVFSHDWRVAGLSRLFGMSPADPSELGRFFSPDFSAVLVAASGGARTLVVLDHIGEAMAKGRTETASEMAQDLDEKLLSVVADSRPVRVLLAATGEDGALALSFDSENQSASTLPFDERVLEERRATRSELWMETSRALGP